MSQRGSFVTEYLYCAKCFEAVKHVLLEHDKSLCSVVVPHWNTSKEGAELPIIAGKIGHSFSAAHAMEFDLAPELARVICHPVRIAVLDDVGPNADQSAHTIVVLPQS